MWVNELKMLSLSTNGSVVGVFKKSGFPKFNFCFFVFLI